jgi:tRNA dimethylallyltransferase
MNKKVCIIITGATAVGKTSLAIEVAQHFKTSVISADSRQCYKELNIGVAKPSLQQLQLVKHYFINSHSVIEDVNAAIFERYALNAVNEIFQQHDVAVMVGGTGLYIKAFCEGLDDIPAIEADVRNSILAKYETEGLAWLQNEVKEKDREYYATGEIQNPQRLIRALEVKLSSGKSIRAFQEGEKQKRNFKIIKIGLDLPREELYNNINLRVDGMIQQGLLDEVKSLLPYRYFNALQTVGYTELFTHLDNIITIEKAIESIKKNTRHYGKRQLTWFRRDQSIQWFSPIDICQIIDRLKNWCNYC